MSEDVLALAGRLGVVTAGRDYYAKLADGLKAAVELATEERDRARALAARLESEVAAVAVLHNRVDAGPIAAGFICDGCQRRWPCPTARAVGVTGP